MRQIFTCASTGLAVDVLFYAGGANPSPGLEMDQFCIDPASAGDGGAASRSLLGVGR